MTGLEVKLLNALRAETIPLNLFLHIGNHRTQYRRIANETHIYNQFNKCPFECCSTINGGCCNYCDNLFETVNHFVMYCPKYNALRNQLFTVIGPIYYKYSIPLNLMNILFVPIYVNKHQPKYKLRWQHRKLIYNSLIQFVIQSKRIACFQF